MHYHDHIETMDFKGNEFLKEIQDLKENALDNRDNVFNRKIFMQFPQYLSPPFLNLFNEDLSIIVVYKAKCIIILLSKRPMIFTILITSQCPMMVRKN